MENSDAKAFLKAANDRILAEKKENSYKEGIFEIVDSLALTVGKKKAFSKMSEMHAKYAAFISLPDAMQSLTDSDFVKHYKVFKNGPYLWKSRNDVSRAREFLLYEIMRRYTPLVLQNLATGAQRKNWNT